MPPSSIAPAPAPPMPPSPVAATPATAAPAPAAPATTAPPTNAEDAPATPQDYADAEAKAKAEKERFTPEIRENARALADKKYKSLREGVDASLKSPHRKPGNPERDVYRHPVETLEFFGLKPTMTVLEYGPGEGWYTELLAPLLAKSGKLIVTTPDPNGPATDREHALGEAARAVPRQVARALRQGRARRRRLRRRRSCVPTENKLDVILAVPRACTAWQRHGTTSARGSRRSTRRSSRAACSASSSIARQPDAGREGEPPKKGYLPRSGSSSRSRAAGFKLAGKSEVNANPKDTKDYPDGRVDPAADSAAARTRIATKYVAIGESDRMTLKFVKKK